MSAESDDSIEHIDFGGRFARQFFNNNLPAIEGDLHILNPTTSTPVASDNSICDSGYESFGQAHRKSSTSPITGQTFNQTATLDINNNNVNCTPTIIKHPQQHPQQHHHHHHQQQHHTHQHQHQPPQQQQHHQRQSQQSQSKHQLSPMRTVVLPTNSNFTNTNQSLDTSSSSNSNTISNSNTDNKQSNNVSATQSSQSNSLSTYELTKLSAGIGLIKLIMTPNVVVRQQRSNSLFTTTPAVASTSLNASNLWSNSQDVCQRFNNVDKIERAASLHRTAASYSEPQYTWSGHLPSRSYKNPVYSCKVFLGGVPWDVEEQGLIETFGRFGPLRVQWPGNGRPPTGQTKAGYVYLIYESERYVKALLQACTQDYGAGSHPEKYFYQLSSRKMRFKEVQAIPWLLADSNYIRNQSGRPDMDRTVFVGALHGMLTAEGLAKIMSDLFGPVAFVGIDSDKYKYPIGSGRCTFVSQKSYMKAVAAGFIEVKSAHFNKKIQVDPYLNPSQCSICHVQSGPIYCRDCLRYFCKLCWNWHHPTIGDNSKEKEHRPMMRKKRDP